MRNSPFWWILVGFMILLDTYFFQVVKSLTQHAQPRTKTLIYASYWIISIGAILLLFLLPLLSSDKQTRFARSTIFALIAGLFFAKLIASLFFLIDDIRRGVQWIVAKLRSGRKEETGAEAITRSAFLSWAGMFAGGTLFTTLVHGFSNKYKYQVRRVALNLPNLPAGFKGMKVVQLSDIHCGSFDNKSAVIKGVERIMAEKPDMVLFTGDLVNNSADEMDEFIDVFNKIKAPLGVYSVLGNHDYGDYMQWDSDELKKANLARLKAIHGELGWKLLMNEHVAIERQGEKIALLGIENWSAKAGFPKYGDLTRAYAGSENYPFRILMSHDPSHWKAEVCEKFPGIDLCLAGHTHGMQFGVEVPGLKWSPVQYMYREWAGLYEKPGDPRQQLYVNRGFGFIGYPGRVGILPEITVFTFG